MYKENKKEPLSEEEIIEGAYGRDDTSYLSKDEETVLVKRANKGDIKARNRCVSSLFYLSFNIARKVIDGYKGTPKEHSTTVHDLAHDGLKKILGVFYKYRSPGYLPGYFGTVMFREMEITSTNNGLFGPKRSAEVKYLNEGKMDDIEGMCTFSSLSLLDKSNPMIDEACSSYFKQIYSITEKSLPDDLASLSEDEARMREAVDCLEGREKEVIKKRFYEEKTLKEVGGEMNLCAEGARILQLRAFDTIVRRLKANHLPKSSDSLESVLTKEGITGIDKEVENEIEERLKQYENAHQKTKNNQQE